MKTCLLPFCFHERLVGLVVTASAWRAAELGSIPTFIAVLGPVVPVVRDLINQWLPCQASSIIGSVLGLVGPVSVYCDWVG